MELRFAAVAPTVSQRADGKPMLVGYASVFHAPGDPGTEYELWPGLVEHIMPGAFDAAVKEDDCRGLKNHDVNNLLGRVGNKTVRLSTDAKGLRYEIDVPDTMCGKDCAAECARGDMAGSSFSFDVRPGGQRWIERADGVIVREITAVKLYDVGPVTFPAYGATTAGVRAAGSDHAEARVALAEWQATRAAGPEQVAALCRSHQQEMQAMCDAHRQECDALCAAHAASMAAGGDMAALCKAHGKAMLALCDTHRAKMQAMCDAHAAAVAAMMAKMESKSGNAPDHAAAARARHLQILAKQA